MQNYRRVGQYDISTTCYLTYPCQHYVKKTNDQPELMCGSDIYCLLLNDNVSDPHFNDYHEVARRRNHPTPEEKEYDARQHDQMQKSIEDCEKRNAEFEKYRAYVRARVQKEKEKEKEQQKQEQSI